MIWEKKALDADKVRSLAAKYDIDLLSASILCRRGITGQEDIMYFLERDPQALHNPFLFYQMEDAVDRVMLAKDRGEKIALFGDRDTDGITSLVILHRVISEIGCEIEWNLPKGDDPYGLTPGAVKSLSESGCTVLITMDCGITNFDEIALANDLGIDTIIVDHHHPGERLPDALATINPRLDTSGYPFDSLAACGVTAKFAWALLFAKTPAYKQPVTLLNMVPAGGGSYILEAMNVINLVEVSRIKEVLVPGVVATDAEKLVPYFSRQIIVYDKDVQKKALQQVFGNNVEINLNDIAPLVAQSFPSIAGKGLFSLSSQSRFLKYKNNSSPEADTLKSLYSLTYLRKEAATFDLINNMLDLVAVGTLADLMPLHNENRILVNKGLEILNSEPSSGLRELCARQGLLGKKITPKLVSWQLSPVINATGRMGTPHVAAELFLTDNEQRRAELVEDVIKINNERKKLGAKSWEVILPKAIKSFAESGDKLAYTAHKDLKRGITGIMANRLVQYFKAPAIVLSLGKERAVGSMRSPGTVNVKDFLSQGKDIFLDYGGHNHAGGFSLVPENVAEFGKRLPGMTASMKVCSSDDQFISIDAELDTSRLTPDIINIVEKFEPYGESNRPLVFLTRGMMVLEATPVGKTETMHLRLTLEAGKYKWPAIYWEAADELGASIKSGARIDVVFNLGRNYYRNNQNLQLTILDSSVPDKEIAVV